MRKTDETQTTAAIQLIVQGFSDTEIAKKIHRSYTTVARIRESNNAEIVKFKKDIQAKIVDSATDKLSALATDMLKGSKLAMDLIIERIREASPAQAAVILGILQDKYGMILGNPSQTIALRFQGRDDMLGYIKSGVIAKPIIAKPIIDIEPEGIPKPLQQLRCERNAANRAKANEPKRGRGRPRIHPLPDPLLPKRGRGRPRRVPIIPISPLSQYIPPVEDIPDSSHIP